MGSLQAGVEALRARLLAQEAVNEVLQNNNSSLLANVDALQQPQTSGERRPTAELTRRPQDAQEASVEAVGQRSTQHLSNSAGKKQQNKDRHVRRLRRELAKLSQDAETSKRKDRVRRTTDHDDETSGSNPSVSSSTSPGGSGSSPSDSSTPPGSETSESSPSISKPSANRSHGRVEPTRHDGKGEKSKVIRPANSRFKSLLDYRSYFILRRSTAYPPSCVEKAHKMNRRLDGAFHGQTPLTGSDPLGVFTFHTTLRRACDVAGLSHGQALPMLAFRLAGTAKSSLSNALNSRSANKPFTLSTYGEAVNWLLLKYATHATLATAYYNIMTMKQVDSETPTVFGNRFEAQCDRLDGLFHAQDVKDFSIHGLSELVQANVRVLDGQFPDRTVAETFSAAQMYWDGALKLRQSLRPPRTPPVKVAHANHPRSPTVDRPFPIQGLPRSAPRPSSAVRAPSRTDICDNCNEPGHFAMRCPKPYRKRERQP